MRISREDIRRASHLLRQGKLVAFPTETVYGLGGDATNDQAVASIFAAKGRPKFNPLISHVANVPSAMKHGSFNEDALRLAHAFWPGPLTLVVPRAEDCRVSILASAGLNSIALRVPSHPVAQDLITQAGLPVVAPSANPSGGISPTLASHVREGLRDRVALVLDGGPCAIGIESTIVKCMGGEPVLLRPGGIKRATIEDVLGKELLLESMPAGRPDAPGQLEQHYAPRAKVILDVIWPRFDVGLLAFGPEVPSHPGPVCNLSERGDLEEAAANLFRMMHELDRAGVQTIAVMPIPQEGLGEAINDRLKRAAAPFHR
ncbi:MAG TPA: L-threonylcarbamoyladenylate synthase [Aestuariivirgaceae bacterium]|jgi:L-threonylcarbamoyladenylate synthase